MKRAAGLLMAAVALGVVLTLLPLLVISTVRGESQEAALLFDEQLRALEQGSPGWSSDLDARMRLRSFSTSDHSEYDLTVLGLSFLISLIAYFAFRRRPTQESYRYTVLPY